jgi:SAM-dependent methyltransferase
MSSRAFHRAGKGSSHQVQPHYLGLRPGMKVILVSADASELGRNIEREVGADGHVATFAPAAEKGAHLATVAADSSDLVVLADSWTALSNPVAVLRDAARVLRPDGRLILLEQSEGEDCAALSDLVHTLEHNGWTIHRCENVGQNSFLLEAGVSDESVQS